MLDDFDELRNIIAVENAQLETKRRAKIAANSRGITEARKTWTKEQWDAHHARCADYASRNRQVLSEKSTARRQRMKVEGIVMLGGKCIDCDGIFHPNVYDFHHIDERKEPQGKSLTALSIARFKAELAACVLVCANCHRMRHTNAEPKI